MESDDFVLPGTELGFAEEFMPGKGTYEDDGMVYSAMTGTLKIDMKERKIIVEPRTNIIPEPKVGDIVIGKILDVKQQFAVVRVIRLLGNPRELPDTIGTIHISRAKSSYVQDISMEFSGGDIVKAKVVDIKRHPISLGTVEKDLGIIKAYCSKCNIALELENGKLKCPNCSSIESRKCSSDYGNGNV